MVEIRNLKKRFGTLTVLDGISLAIPAGPVTSIVGPNAAGKSTLLKCIVGLVRPDAGEIIIGGRCVNGASRYREGIGYVPQIPHFPENLTAAELFNFVKDVRGVPAVRERELIALFGLEPAMRRSLRELSGGTRQKLSTVLAMMFDPDILLLDEPTVGLDPLSSRRQKELLLEESARGKTVILASHAMAELEEFSDRVVFLLDGRIYFDGTPQEARGRAGERTLERAIAKMMETNP